MAEDKWQLLKSNLSTELAGFVNFFDKHVESLVLDEIIEILKKHNCE